MKKLAIILAAVIVVPYLIFQFLYPSVTHRYRLTLVADDNGKTVTGSGVIEASYWKKSQFMGAHGEYGNSARGETVVVDFGRKDQLFALLKEGTDSRSAPQWIVYPAFGIGRTSPPDQELRQLRAVTDKAELDFTLLPMLVRFHDINDPKTVERVDPNNLAASFGPGVKLVKATIEITRDPVTTGITNRLTWLRSLKGGYLDGRFSGGGPELSNILHGGDLKKE